MWFVARLTGKGLFLSSQDDERGFGLALFVSTMEGASVRFVDWWCDRFEFCSPGRKRANLEEWVGIPIDELQSINLEYRSFYISKRSGGRRLLHAPNESLRRVQRQILRRLLKGLKTHPAAVGFERGKSIVTGARQHARQEIVLSFDIVDFFPSISAERVCDYFRLIGWNRPARNLLVGLVTHNGCLPQGAPTSPRLSNLVNYHMDVRFAQLAKNYKGVYTRYADDITFSVGRGDWDTEKLISQILMLIRGFGYEPHVKRKFDVRRRHQRQEVTGLVVNEGVRLPRERRRWLRAVKHRARAHWGYVDPQDPNARKSVLCKAPTLTEQQFKGWLSFEQMVNRDGTLDEKPTGEE